MSYLKKYGKRLFYTIISILLSLLLITCLYYFNIIGNNTYKFLKIIIILINIFISSFLLGKKATNKGYLEGIKLASIVIIIFFILTILVKETFELKNTIYYLIILVTSTFGGMVGISKKK